VEQRSGRYVLWEHVEWWLGGPALQAPGGPVKWGQQSRDAVGAQWNGDSVGPHGAGDRLGPRAGSPVSWGSGGPPWSWSFVGPKGGELSRAEHWLHRPVRWGVGGLAVLSVDHGMEKTSMS
jgi:hypothetical protein